ncbi:unnamed protein product [Trifolium pratense]|uniref:Uncharacterized protein n=1 Tax=Trifolium pratense TaxID=57577 RepID=A0ACB0J6E5_TRIPR|nr:unnamed protein product [Trifolium pratense]
MYPQQQYQVPPFNLQQQQQQPYYSSSLYPPGTDPVANSTSFSAPASVYASQTTDYPNWIGPQSEHIVYDPAVGSSYEASAASASLPPAYATWSYPIYGNDTTTVLPNQTKVSKALRCEVCKIDLNSKDSYEKHIAGKKHKKNLQVRLLSNNGIGPSSAEFKRSSIGPLQKAAKKIKVAQSAWCEVCKITCNSMDIYITHLAGKKHLKNLEKLSNPKTDAGIGATTTSTAANTLIGPQEKPDTDKPNKAPELDIETKKRKVVEGGAAVNHIKMCTLCNVVCNSQIVFDSHLVGQKHAAMAKKAGSSTG